MGINSGYSKRALMLLHPNIKVTHGPQRPLPYSPPPVTLPLPSVCPFPGWLILPLFLRTHLLCLLPPPPPIPGLGDAPPRPGDIVGPS